MCAYAWSGPLMHVAPTVTGDRRRYAGDGVTSRSLPLPLRYSPLGGHHEKAVDIGGITSIDLSTNPITGTGFFLPEHIEPQVVPAMYKLAAGINGISVDLEPGSLEMQVVDSPDGGQILDVSKSQIMAATSVSKPAFADTRLNITQVDDSRMPFALVAAAAEQLGWTLTEEVDDDWAMEQYALIAAANVTREGFVAGGGPLAPSKQVFDDPHLSRPTKVTITADGRVYGHVALWNTCHTGVGNSCVLAPHSKLGYAKFHTGNVLTSEGDVIEAGRITLGGGHANTRLGLIPAAEHYDNTCAQVAVVRAGEDSHGIWFAGSLLPGVSDRRIAELRRSPLSGDWRLDRTVGNLELIAALAVNSPGFPVFEMEGNDQLSLIAAGMVVDMATDEDALGGWEADLNLSLDEAQAERTAALAAIVIADEVKKQNMRAAQLAKITGEEAK